MTVPNNKPKTMAGVLAMIAAADLSATKRRDMISSINRLCEMAGYSASNLPAEAGALRQALQKIHPAKFDVTAKTFSNLKSLLAAALQQVGVFDDMGRGSARRDPTWGALMEAVGSDQQLSNGLDAFANWCTPHGIAPGAVTDETVTLFSTWLETRTHCLKPRDVARRTPILWNEASAKFACWPKTNLSRIFFKTPRMYLDANPEDFQTPQAILHHASAKTTQIYAGSSSRRAGRAYSKILFEQREKLRIPPA